MASIPRLAPRVSIAWVPLLLVFVVASEARAQRGQFDKVPVNPADEAFIFTPDGFSDEGKPAVASGERIGRLRVTILDQETQKTTPCRVNVVSADGNFYYPPADHLTPYRLTGTWPDGNGNRPSKAPIRYFGHFFYSPGTFEVEVPEGSTRIEAWKGFEHGPERLSTDVVAGATRDVALTLSRRVPMGEHGYYSGDTHLHFARTSDDDDRTIFDLLEAEDIRYGTVLCYNENTAAYMGSMAQQASPQRRGLGGDSVRQRGPYQIISAQEYRATHYGHVNLYLRGSLVLNDVALDPNTWPVFGEIARETRSLGGISLHAHGGYAQEIYADIASGATDGVELLQFGIYRGIGLEGWYHVLNAGFRFPAVGASDYPACRKLGDCRTYVYSPATPTIEQWLRAAAAGSSFFTTAPLVLLEVDGQPPGSTHYRQGDGPFRVRAQLRVRCEVAPVTDMQLIVNGQVAAHLPVPPKQGTASWLVIERDLELTKSSWIAARAFSRAPSGSPDAEAHTNPVYVYINGRSPYSEASLDFLVAQLDEQIAALGERDFTEKPRALEYFQSARAKLLEIRESAGRPAPAQIERLSQHASHESLAAELRPIPPREPHEALATFELKHGFHLDLVAHEPLVTDPIAAAFDENGRLYVAEMCDYPYHPKEGEKPLGRIRLLVDTNADGVFDEGHVFADGLLWPSGVAPWKGGAVVAATPDLWYLKDTDGDCVADERRKLYSGFGDQNQQGMLNNLIWGLDHRIYGATSVNGGRVRPADEPDAQPLALDARDFRYDPASGKLEATSGRAQFGNTFDDWGNRFLCSESHPAYHVVLPDHYLVRNPSLPVPTAINDLAPGVTPVFRTSPIEPWRAIRTRRRMAAGERAATSAGASHHVIDAGAGVTVYRSAAFPADLYGNLFIGDAQNNLVHRRRLVPDGVSFKSERADEATEFIRSRDNWFRPVNFVNAPDGTLYMLDMYREVIESVHIPLDVVAHLDLTRGRDRGRIYRIAPDGFSAIAPPRLGDSATSELVTHLEHPSAWWRETAHRLIYERQDRSVVPALARLLQSGKTPQARLHALWSLDGLGSLSDDDLQSALADGSPRVREHAVRLTEARLARSPALLDTVLSLAGDDDPRVRFQVAFSLGEVDDPRMIDALAKIARRDAADSWMRSAIASSIAGNTHGLLAELIDSDGVDDLVTQLASLAGAVGDPSKAASVLDLAVMTTLQETRRRRILAGLADGLRRAGSNFAAVEHAASQPARDVLRAAIDTAAQTFSRDDTSVEETRTAIDILSATDWDRAQAVLLGLLEPRRPPAVQHEAIRALSGFHEADVAEALVERWPSMTPSIRADALSVLMASDSRIARLLDAVDDARIEPGQLPLDRVQQLLDHSDATLRDRARKTLGAGTSADRRAVIARYLVAIEPLSSAADHALGEKIYRRECMTCHALGSEGHEVGPNLALSRNRAADALVAAILDPNREVPPAYVQYQVVDRQGRVASGIIAAESGTSITLRRAENVQDVILHRDIEEIASTGKSLMPEGFEQKITPEEMAHLIAFLLDVQYHIGTKPNFVE